MSTWWCGFISGAVVGVAVGVAGTILYAVVCCTRDFVRKDDCEMLHDSDPRV